MANDNKKNPLIAEEDWWAVWFGLFILVVATALGALGAAGTIDKVKVPKLGKWVSSPADVLYAAKTTKISLEEGTTVSAFVEKVNGTKASARAALIPVTGEPRVRLRIESARPQSDETISVETLLEGGDAVLELSPDATDAGGLGARAYVSQPLDAESIVGRGKVVITAQRESFIALPLLLTLLFVLGVTIIGVRVMGQNAVAYALSFVVIFIIAALAFLVANYHVSHAYGLSYAAWALGVGLFISNTVGTPKWLKPAIRTEMYIKTGLVLLGAEILFGKILSVGLPGLMVAWIVTPIVIIFMWYFGTRILKMVSKPLVIVIAAATSVCGVSAAIAVAAASRAKKEELTLGVGMTLIFTVIMMIFMPMFIHWVGMSPILGGAWMGGTIDSTGAVVAAGAFLGPEAETVAAVVKMIQNVLIGIVGFAVALFWVTSVERDANGPRPGLGQIWVRFPKFIVGFVAASLLFSFVLTPMFAAMFEGDGLKLVESSVIKAATSPLRGWFFCLAFVSIGLESNFKELAKQMAGGKPMLLYVVGQTFNLILTLAVAWLAFSVIFTDSV